MTAEDHSVSQQILLTQKDVTSPNSRFTLAEGETITDDTDLPKANGGVRVL